ncbi:MAG: Family ership [Pseudomonadota bacterium]
MVEDKKQGLGRIALKRLSVEAADSAEPFSATDAQLRELSERYQRPALDLSRVRIPLELLDLLPRETAELHALLPVRIKDDALLVAMIEPDNASVLDELSFVTGKRIVPYVAPAADVREAISSAYLAKRRGEKFYEGPRCAIVAAEAPEAPATSGLVGAPDSRFESPTRGAPSVSEPKAVVPPVPPARNVNRATPASAPLEPSSPPATRQSAAMVRPPPDIPDLVVGNIAIREAPRKPSEAFQALDFEDEAGGEKVSLSLSFDNLPAAGAASGRGLSSDQVPAVPHQKGVANGFRVLLVEDDSEIAQLVRRLLEAEGYAVIVAPDGEAALTRLKQEAPHVLLLDAMLPKVHGFEVVRRVRASRRLADLPIVILSAVHRGWGYAEDLRSTTLRSRLTRATCCKWSPKRFVPQGTP